MQLEISTMDLAFLTALLVFLGAVGGLTGAVYRFIHRIDTKLERLDTEFANGHDIEARDADDYLGMRAYVEKEFGEVRDRFADGGRWMRDHEQRRADEAHGRVQPPRSR